MQEEAAQELIQGYGHQFLLIVVSRVPPAKGDLAVGQRDQSMVGDGDAVGVTAEILEHILGAPEGWFGVDHPVFAKQRSQPGGEEFGLREQMVARCPAIAMLAAWSAALSAVANFRSADRPAR